MSDKELKSLADKLDHGLLLAEMRMLQDKAIKDQTIIVCDENNKIKSIPARNFVDVLWKIFHKNDRKER